MKAMDCLLFLLGSRGAILRIATCRAAVWVGLFFVFVAAFAREYDQEYLLARPWYLLIPAGASLLVATLLFGMLITVAGRAIAWRGYYRQFVSLFWMTAPLAWFYAIPYEQFLDERTAALANLWTLGVVSLWRVVLIVRVSNVLFETNSEETAPPILLVSDTVMLIGLQFVPFPLIQLMGGAGDSAQDVMARTGCCALGLGVLAWPVLSFVTGVMQGARRKKKLPWAKPPSFRGDVVVHRGTWWVGILPLIVGAVPIYYAQMEQRSYYLQELRSEAQPAEATQAALQLMAELDRLRYWADAEEERVALAAQFGVWLAGNGQQWVVNHTDARVNLMLEQIVNYPNVRAAAPDFVEYLRREEATMRSGIDRKLLEKILH